MGIATIKASLVAMFFMHLKDDNRFNVLIFVGALVFMGVFFVYTMNDTQHRGQWDNSYGTEVSDSGEEAPGRGLFQEIHVKASRHGEARRRAPLSLRRPSQRYTIKAASCWGWLFVWACLGLRAASASSASTCPSTRWRSSATRRCPKSAAGQHREARGRAAPALRARRTPTRDIVERYSIRQRDCLYTVSVRQEWPMATADVEVIYDDKLMPLRIWKRMTLPGLPDAGEKADIRRYDLRTDPVTMKRRQMSGAIDYELLKGGHPVAVIGPGRGLISMWIKRAKLQVGQKVRELAIDVRALEKIGLVTLRREDDMVHDVLGPVRVYTFYGREAVFTDAERRGDR